MISIVEKPVSTMSEEIDERRKRLKALKEKANKSIKFRNYRPQDVNLKAKASNIPATRGHEDKQGVPNTQQVLRAPNATDCLKECGIHCRT